MSKMQVTLLGTGTSCGVPQLGCCCPVCTSDDPRDRRLRCSVLVEIEDKKSEGGVTRILLDCGPDFRQQMILNGFRRIDAIFISHEHYDHVGGIDDIRPFSVFGDMVIYADDYCATHLMERIPYCFTPKDVRYPGVPRIDLERVEPAVAFADKLSVEKAYIIHMSHHVGLHAEEDAKLPANRHLAYDGMSFSIDYHPDDK